MGALISILSLIRNFIFGGTLLGKFAMWGVIAAAALIAIKAWDIADDRAAIRKHEGKKIEHVRKKVKNARRAARAVRTDSDVRRVLEDAARGN